MSNQKKPVQYNDSDYALAVAVVILLGIIGYTWEDWREYLTKYIWHDWWNIKEYVVEVIKVFQVQEQQ